MKQFIRLYQLIFLKGHTEKLALGRFLICSMLFLSSTLVAQNRIVIKGLVLDEKKEPMIGATITVKGNRSVGTVSDIDGRFTLSVPTNQKTLVISYVSYTTKEINIEGKSFITIEMANNAVNLNDVVVVGYGKQKKESVVGSITTATAKELERTGGVSNLGMALAGNLPGVVVSSSTGMPGAEDPKIIIRTQTSWNNSDPLVLVDGIERSMSTIDIASVESVSVLKDASATAVYGVRGANGVILITTKRGKEGKANIQIRSSMTMKVASKLPEKYDSYDALLLKNNVVERELPLASGGWSFFTPKQIIEKYRNPANAAEWDQYPNVDWENELFKHHTMSYNTSVNVSGGTKNVKYFNSVDFIHEGDLFKTIQSNRGYNSGYGYNRTNVRSNLDFELTKTTHFSTNLFGSSGVRQLPYGASDTDASYWSSAYLTAPDAMRPIYSDGTWGYYAPRIADVPNSVQILATSGIEKRTTTQINTDFVLKQDLSMITKGLEIKADLTLDNTFKETGRGIDDRYNNAQRKWVNPASGAVSYEQPINTGTRLDYSDGVRWANTSGSVDTTATYRKQYYSLQLNYARKFGRHNVGAMGMFSRDETATGSEFHHYREDWVFRTTYDYASKYFVEINGAYNGSEKFSSANRFAFFPSFSGGWMMTEEKFMNKLKFIDMLKLRASWGKVGDDNVTGSSRWLYQDQWSYGGTTSVGETLTNSSAVNYRVSALGNENVTWETTEKRNFGVDYAFLGGLVSGSLDIFNDDRTNILISGVANSYGIGRAVPSYFGATAPVSNMGEVKSHGFELSLKLSHRFSNGLYLWGQGSMTHGVNKIIYADDATLLASYLKKAGYSIGQTTAYLSYGNLATWDDVYGSTARTTGNSVKLAGDYNIIDFNGDGTIDSNDKAPYQYSSIPQNTYNLSLGFEWKGLSCFLQFYGVNNVTREVYFPTFQASSDVAYVEGTYWSKNGSGTLPLARWSTTLGDDAKGTRYLYDGSYIRLKNAEIAYTFTGKWVKSLGVNACKFYLNGDNLWLWSKMPDDRESNFQTYGNSQSGAYPTVRRFNLGLDITL
ncbi:MAG: TonB dependent receptor [Bacteroidetes bacterium]|nr:TonB dependent receptor [Bacteroidota bacterium]